MWILKFENLVRYMCVCVCVGVRIKDSVLNLKTSLEGVVCVISSFGVGHNTGCCRFRTSVVFVAMTLGDSESLWLEKEDLQ